MKNTEKTLIKNIGQAFIYTLCVITVLCTFLIVNAIKNK
ncbi:hypothetical protein CLVI_07120 [Clostridium vincentii]|uniref:Uncharacterized protein n=1 Tax=Clostridium vincentii TaxID=52704 RepID=A0A2T0BIP5_9CLOT|nr:hypothetical protein CLVI_07120 [Clostridium vincentii]